MYATTVIEDHGFTPLVGFHLVESNGDGIGSSDDAYADVTSRLDLKTADDE
ncbi:hypothetical protein [Halovivax limisalsi]|uniref:hypothetical protein n=1 Tax=Halovivax limisalsi TaxID=1453760 RepID=UPI003CCE5376